MADDFKRASREREPWSNADDPNADRAGRYPEAGELNAASGATERVGSETGPGTAPITKDPGGVDSDLTKGAAAGTQLGGYHATHEPGEPGLPAGEDPGLPGHDQPAEGGREEIEEDLNRR